MLFSQFGIYQERLEIKAIQAYSQNHNFEYIPVLDIELSKDFEKKLTIVSENINYQKILDNYISLERVYGFQFLNSEQQIDYSGDIGPLFWSIWGQLQFSRFHSKSA